MSKKKVLYILLVLINILLVIFLVVKFIGNNSQEDINDNNTIYSGSDEMPSDDLTVVYKKFILTIPDGISYEEKDQYCFMLNGDGFDSVVEIFLMDQDIFENKDLFYEELIREDYKVDDEELIDTLYGKVLIYKSTDEDNKKVYGYYKLFDSFVCEIILHNSDDSFATDKLEHIIKILSSSQYDHESTERYYYHRVTLNTD